MGCITPLSSGILKGPATYRQKMDMRYNLLKRSYLVHVPPACDPMKAFPLVVVLHGAFDNASGVEKATGFSQLADRENFIVQYPNGISPRRGGERRYYSVPESINFWVSHNGCDATVDEQTAYQGGVTVKSWKGCSDGTEVSLYLLKEWGHVWPVKVFLGSLETGHPLKEFEATEIIWDFFKRHHR
jgi:poly(3-hydroxybutyrate) depolymerase